MSTTKVKQFLTAAEFAELASVQTRTIWDWHKAGVGPRPVKIRRRLLFDSDAVLAFLKGESK